MPYKDLAVRKAYMTQYRLGWAARNPDKVRAYDAINKQRYRDRINDMKRDRPCMDCGGIFPVVCMDFDHREPAEKQFSVAGSKRTLEILLAEIAKCDLVCANCHRLRTQEQWESGLLGRPIEKAIEEEIESLPLLDLIK